jgi:hypothetical protein
MPALAELTATELLRLRPPRYSVLRIVRQARNTVAEALLWDMQGKAAEKLVLFEKPKAREGFAGEIVPPGGVGRSLLATSNLDLGTVIRLANRKWEQTESVSAQNRISRCEMI